MCINCFIGIIKSINTFNLITDQMTLNMKEYTAVTKMITNPQHIISMY